MKKVINLIISVVVLLTVQSCQDCAIITESKIHIIYKDGKELKNIQEFILKYLLVSNCVNSDDCYRYLVTIQHIQSERIDTVLPAPEYPRVGSEKNLKLAAKILEDSLQISFKNWVKESIPPIPIDSIEKRYNDVIMDLEHVYAFLKNKKEVYRKANVITIYEQKALGDSIAMKTCNGINELFVLWEPGSFGTTKPPPPAPPAPPPPPPPPSKDCDLVSQQKKLEDQLIKAQKQTALNSLRALAYNAIECGESNSIKIELEKMQKSKLKSLISDYEAEFRGVMAALELEDTRIINESLGRLIKIDDDIYQVTLLSSNSVFDNSPKAYNLPPFKLTTQRFSLTSPQEVILNWPKQAGGYESLVTNLKPGSPITKEFETYKVTLSMNSIVNSPIVKIQINLNLKKQEDIGIKEGDGTGTTDLLKDTDKDGFIGYLDINDNDPNLHPSLTRMEKQLGDRVSFSVVNGSNLKDIGYEWSIGGVKFAGKEYTIADVGCYDIEMLMTHNVSGISKKLNTTMHASLPIKVLEADLDAILRLGLYKPPSQPPSIEKKRADDAEARIDSYFAQGCGDVKDQFNQKRNYIDLINDLRGGSGQLKKIEVKTIQYKNNGCDKVCSFTYILSN